MTSVASLMPHALFYIEEGHQWIEPQAVAIDLVHLAARGALNSAREA